MYGTLGQIPDQPGIYRTEKQFSPLCPFSDTGYIIQDPGNLGSTEISIRDQAGLLPDDFVKTVFFQFLDHIGGPAALPYNGIVYRFPGIFIPENRSLTLIRDADGLDLVIGDTQHRHTFNGHSQLGGPDFHRVMLYPAWLGIDLCEFFLCHGTDISLFIKQDTAGTRGSLIQCHDVCLFLCVMCISHCVM